MILALKIVAILCLLIYIVYLIYSASGFIKSKFYIPVDAINKTKTCIIICARNEEKNIGECLRSILNQDFDFSLLEVVLVNDGSTDKTLEIAQKVFSEKSVSHQIITNQNSLGKKASITSAINACNSELIITRDADTYTENSNWLSTIVSFYESTKKELIICPIEIIQKNSTEKNNILNQLQFLENNALSIITAGFARYKKPFLCSGANLAFSKNIFLKVNGYQSHKEIISGDDVLFLEDVKKYNSNCIAYLKNKSASISTYPIENLRKMMFQKFRWASKFDKNPNKTNTFLALIVLMVHLFGLFYLFRPLFAHHIPVFGIIFNFLRVLFDFLLLFLASRYFNRPVNWFWFLPLSFFYSFYVITTAFLSIIIKPNRN